MTSQNIMEGGFPGGLPTPCKPPCKPPANPLFLKPPLYPLGFGTPLEQGANPWKGKLR
jgi:hypothetical protein